MSYPQSPVATLSWYDVPDEAKQLLMLAADHWAETTVSEQYVHQALERAGNNPDVLVSAYRYFFYKHNNPIALAIARMVTEQVRLTEQLPETWEQLKPIVLARKEEPVIRLFLNAYAATGLILARLGDLEEAKEIATRVNEVDDKREFGGSTVLGILTAPPDEED